MGRKIWGVAQGVRWGRWRSFTRRMAGKKTEALILRVFYGFFDAFFFVSCRRGVDYSSRAVQRIDFVLAPKKRRDIYTYFEVYFIRRHLAVKVYRYGRLLLASFFFLGLALRMPGVVGSSRE